MTKTLIDSLYSLNKEEDRSNEELKKKLDNNYEKSFNNKDLFNEDGTLKNKTQLNEYINTFESEEDKLKKINAWKKEAVNLLENEDEKNKFNTYLSDINNLKSKEDGLFFINNDAVNDLLYEYDKEGNKKLITLKKLGSITKGTDSGIALPIQNLYLEKAKNVLSDEDYNKLKKLMNDSGSFVSNKSAISGISAGTKELGRTIANAFKSDEEIIKEQSGLINPESFKKERINKNLGVEHDDKVFMNAFKKYIEYNPDDIDVQKYLAEQKGKKDSSYVFYFPNDSLKNKVINFNNDFLLSADKKDVTEDLTSKQGLYSNLKNNPYQFIKGATKVAEIGLAGLPLAFITGGAPAVALAAVGGSGLNAVSSFIQNNEDSLKRIKDKLEQDGVDFQDIESIKQGLATYQDELKKEQKGNRKNAIYEFLAGIPLGLLAPVMNTVAIKGFGSLAQNSNKALQGIGKVASNKQLATAIATINDSVIPTTTLMLPDLVKGNISFADLAAYNLQSLVSNIGLAPLSVKGYRDILENSSIVNKKVLNKKIKENNAKEVVSDLPPKTKKQNSNVIDDKNVVEAVNLSQAVDEMSRIAPTEDAINDILYNINNGDNPYIAKEATLQEINNLVDTYKLDRNKINFDSKEAPTEAPTEAPINDRSNPIQKVIEKYKNIFDEKGKIRQDLIDEVQYKTKEPENIVKSKILKEYSNLENSKYEASELAVDNPVLRSKIEVNSKDNKKALILNDDNTAVIRDLENNRDIKKFINLDDIQNLNKILTDENSSSFTKKNLNNFIKNVQKRSKDNEYIYVDNSKDNSKRLVINGEDKTLNLIDNNTNKLIKKYYKINPEMEQYLLNKKDKFKTPAQKKLLMEILQNKELKKPVPKKKNKSFIELEEARIDDLIKDESIDIKEKISKIIKSKDIKKEVSKLSPKNRNKIIQKANKVKQKSKPNNVIAKPFIESKLTKQTNKISKLKAETIIKKFVPEIKDIVAFDDSKTLKNDALAKYNEFKDRGINAIAWYDPVGDNIHVDLSKINGTSILSPEEQLKFIVTHELSHKHARKYLEAQDILTIARNNKFISEALPEIAKRWDLDLSSNDGKLRATEELLAELSAATSNNFPKYMQDNYGITIPKLLQNGFVGDVLRSLNKLVSFFKKISGNNNITNADIYDLVSNLGSGLGSKEVQKTLNTLNTLSNKIKVDANNVTYDDNLLTYQDRSSNGDIENVKFKDNIVYERYSYKDTQTKLQQLEESFIKNTANWFYPIENFLSKLDPVLKDDFNKSETKLKARKNDNNYTFKEVSKNIIKAHEILKTDNSSITRRQTEQFLYEYAIANDIIKNNKNQKLLEKKIKAVEDLKNDLKEFNKLKDSFKDNENISPEIKNATYREIDNVKKQIKEAEMVVLNHKNRVNANRDSIDPRLDKFAGGMTDGEAKTFVKNFESKPYYQKIKPLYDEALNIIFNRRKIILDEALKNKVITEKHYKDFIQDKYWLTAQELYTDKYGKTFFDGISETNNNNLLIGFNSKNFDMSGRATPPTNLLNNMSITLDRLAIKSSYNNFVKNLIKHSNYDVNKPYIEQLTKIDRDPIGVKPVFATDYGTTKGFITHIKNDLGNYIEHKVYFNDEGLNRIMFDKPDLLINKEGVTGKILSFIDWTTKTTGKFITLRPFAFSKIIFRSIGEELSLINNNENNKVFKNIEVAQAKVTAEFVHRGNIYAKAIQADHYINIGLNEKGLDIIKKYGLDGINSDIYEAVKNNRYEGITTNYSSSLKRNEEYVIDLDKFKDKNWIDKGLDVFKYGEEISRSIITKTLRDMGYSYEQALKMQREAVNMSKKSFSLYAQLRDIATPFAKSISISSYQNYKSIKKNPKNFIYNIGNKATKLMMLEALVQYGLNPLINEVSSIFTGQKDDIDIPDKYYNFGIPIYLPYDGGRIVVIPYGFGLSNIYGVASEFLNRPIRKYIKGDGYNFNQLKGNVNEVLKVVMEELNPAGNIEAFSTHGNKTLTQNITSSVCPQILKGLIVDNALGVDRHGNRFDRMSNYAKDNTEVLTKKATNIINKVFGSEYSYRQIENIISYIPLLNNIESSLKKGEKEGFVAGIGDALGLTESTLSVRTDDKKINDMFYSLQTKYKKEFDLAYKPIAEFKKHRNEIDKKVYSIIKAYKNAESSLSAIHMADKEKEVHKKAQNIILFRKRLINKLYNLKND